MIQPDNLLPPSAHKIQAWAGRAGQLWSSPQAFNTKPLNMIRPGLQLFLLFLGLSDQPTMPVTPNSFGFGLVSHPGWTPLHWAAHCGNVECLVALLNAGAATAGFSFTAGFKNKAVPRAGHVAKKPSLEHPTCTGHAGEQRPHPQGCCSTRAGLQSFRMSQRLSPRFDPATLGGQSRTDRVPGDPSERRRCRGMAGDLSVVACCGLGHTSPRSESVMTHIKN